MTFRTALALVLVVATPALAQRVSFPNFSGPSAASVRNQLVSAVCDTADCISQAKTTTGGKPDWKKARKESVAFFVTGTVAKKGKALSVDVAVLNKAGPPKARRSFPLEGNGTLSPKNLQAVMDLLTGAFGGRSSEPTSPTPPVEKTSPKEPTSSGTTSTTTSSGTGKGPSRPADPPPPEEKKPAREPEPVRAEPPRPSGKAKPKFLVIDAGADLLNRKLEYTQVATSNLRRYDLNLFAQPTVGLEFYPLALVREDLLAGLGVEFNIGFAPWLQSRLASVTDSFPTSTMRIDAGVRWNLAPLQGFALTFTPYVGVRSHSFSVSALPDGRRIDGLPNISFLGLRAGLGLDIPIVPKWLNVFGHFGVVPIFGAGEILSAAFFPSGNAFGLEANAGVGIGLVSFMQVRLSFEWMNYGMTFRTQPTDTYVATGATDTYLGGKAVVRFSF